MDFETELDILIRARYPILYLVTSEEARVQASIREMADRGQKKIFEWSITTGLVPAGTSIQSQKTRNSPTREPLAALNEVIDLVEPALFLFKDFHPFLERSRIEVIRRLKEIALHLQNSHKTIILVSPVLEIPPELDKEITVLTFPLPGKADLGRLLDRITDEVRPFGNITVDLDEAGRERLLQAALGLTMSEAENVFAKIVVKSERLSVEDLDEIFFEKQQIIRKSGLLEYYDAKEDFESVGGLAELKEWLVKRALAFTPEAQAFGLPAPRGVLMLGVQGCGKSLCAKAVASQWRLPLLRFDMGRMFGSLVGSSEENARRAIAVAESVAPVILWVDEIDKAFAGARGSASVDGGTTARVFGTFLTWLAEKSAPVFVAATANDISELPPELLRKGRFDEIFFVDLPTDEERAEIFRIHIARRGRDPALFDLADLVRASVDFSGAEIEQSVVAALFDAFHRKEELTGAHILGELHATVPLARTMAEQVDSLRRWADGRARHASVARKG